MNTERRKFNFYSDYRLLVDGLEERLDLVIAERKAEIERLRREEEERLRREREQYEYAERQRLEKSAKERRKKYQSIIDWADENHIPKSKMPRDIYILGRITSLNLSLFEDHSEVDGFLFIRFTNLPESIGNLTQLTELHLNFHKLTSLPESIGNLTNLTKLYLRANRLTELPDSIGNLTQLTELHLDSNELISLPKSIANLTNLTQINLCGNQLEVNKRYLIENYGYNNNQPLITYALEDINKEKLKRLEEERRQREEQKKLERERQRQQEIEDSKLINRIKRWF